MAAGDFPVSLLGPFYYGTAGSQATTQTTNIGEVRFSANPTFATATKRVTSGVPVEGAKAVKLENPSLTFKVWAIEADAFLAALIAAWTGITKIALRALDRSGGEGPDFDAYIQMAQEQDDGGYVFYNVEARHAVDGRAFTWG